MKKFLIWVLALVALLAMSACALLPDSQVQATPPSKTAVPAKASPTPVGELLTEGRTILTKEGDFDEDFKAVYIVFAVKSEMFLTVNLQFRDSDRTWTPTGGVLKKGANHFEGLGITVDVTCNSECHFIWDYKRPTVTPDPKCAQGFSGQFKAGLPPDVAILTPELVLMKNSDGFIRLFGVENGEITDILIEAPWPQEGKIAEFQGPEGQAVQIKNCNGVLLWLFTVKRSS